MHWCPSPAARAGDTGDTTQEDEVLTQQVKSDDEGDEEGMAEDMMEASSYVKRGCQSQWCWPISPQDFADNIEEGGRALTILLRRVDERQQ